MRVFMRIAETGGFAEAARQLNTSPPAVTRAVAALEDAIGTRLLTRTTRSVKLTEAGARYVEDCRNILAAIEEAEAAAAGLYATPSGTLTVTSSVMFGQIYIMPVMTEFLDRHPQVSGRLLLLDRIVNLVDEGVDVAIRIGRLPDSSYSAVRVGSVRRVVCGSPAYFKKHGMPRTPADLANHRIVAATGAWPSLEWRFGRDAHITVNVKPALLSNSNEATISAARSGWGLTRALSYQVGPDLAKGSLQIVLEDFEQPPLPVHIVHAGGRNASAKVRAFIDFARDRLRANQTFRSGHQSEG
ncbi:LysR family transcriptional regulator [Porphyrobacter sp. ULC335]|uniref:LysR family transcriptional regulator n=1 Tax=Porphyrobacter sp. ULC335 TaxID=2854260 RepID=UPI002220FF65|nr:LysR family transcriptional regulator [Porphyrobacter sp. ULC335]UYV16708.1 LysR family transcriptional regulator [Porphyrobacter sp. ULC335]